MVVLIQGSFNSTPGTAAPERSHRAHPALQSDRVFRRSCAFLQPEPSDSASACHAREGEELARAPLGEEGDNCPLLVRSRGVEKLAGCSGNPTSVGSLRKSTHALQAARMGLR